MSVRVARVAWDVDRFGLSPRKLKARLLNRGEPSVACITLPKAGTHLLERALCLHPTLYRRIQPTIHDRNLTRFGGLKRITERTRPGEVVIAHLEWSEERESILKNAQVRSLFMIRDPRDVVVSQAHYVPTQKRHQHYEAFRRLPDLRSRIHLAIVGDETIACPSIATRLADYAGWLQSADLTVRFEDLIQSDSDHRNGTLRNIFRSIGIDVNEATVSHISAHMVSRSSRTFRKGGAGGWRSLFDDEMTAVFQEVAGKQLEQFGYVP